MYDYLAKDCIALQEKAGFYNTDRYPIYKEKQSEIKQILAKTPTANEIIDLLKLVDLDFDSFIDFYSVDIINDAILYAKDLKDRFTVLWLYYDLVGEKLYGKN